MLLATLKEQGKEGDEIQDPNTDEAKWWRSGAWAKAWGKELESHWYETECPTLKTCLEMLAGTAYGLM